MVNMEALDADYQLLVVLLLEHLYHLLPLKDNHMNEGLQLMNAGYNISNMYSGKHSVSRGTTVKLFIVGI